MPRVFVSSVIDAPAARVWERVRDFNGLPRWHPRIRESRIENGEPPDKVGCVRDFNLQNGDRIRERLLACPTTTCSAPIRSWKARCRSPATSPP